MHTVIRHGVERRTRRATIALLRWDVFWPFPTSPGVTRLDDLALGQLGRNEVVNGQGGIPAEKADVGHAVRDGAEDTGHAGRGSR